MGKISNGKRLNKSILLIEASNIGGEGGSITHLREFLKHSDFEHQGVSQVLICTSQSVFDKVKNDRPVIQYLNHKWLNRGYLKRLLWQIFVLPGILKKHQPLLFIPGTGYPKRKYPFVTMFRNLLPVDTYEMDRYKYSATWLRYKILRQTYFTAFKQASGLICMNDYIFNEIPLSIKEAIRSHAIIPHGLSEIFKIEPKVDYKIRGKIRLLYVSRINLYKHQWVVAEAVLKLKDVGYDVELKLVGSQKGYGQEKLEKVCNSYNDDGKVVKFIEEVSQANLVQYYHDADIFIFASTCETFGMILLEAMGAGLPVISSDKSSMKTLLKDNGLYFDVENVDSLIQNLKSLIESEKLREKYGQLAHKEALKYNWKDTSAKTLAYIRKVLD